MRKGEAGVSVSDIVSEEVRPQLIKLRGCRVSEPLARPWGEPCRIVEWIDPEGQYSCLVVPGQATKDEIRERIRAHRNGPQYIVRDEQEDAVRTVRRRF